MSLSFSTRRRPSFGIQNRRFSSMMLVLAALPLGAEAATFTVPPTGDPSYQIISNTITAEPGTTPVVVPATQYAASWGPNTLGAPWIAPAANQKAVDNTSCCVGDLKYTTTFSLQGLDPTTARLVLNVLADDYVSVYLNGTQVFAPTGVMYVTPTTIPITTGFVAGANTLEFDVHNFGGSTGLSVAAASGTADVQSTAPPQLSVAPGIVGGTAVSGTNANDTSIAIYARNLGSGGALPLSFQTVSTPSCTASPNFGFFQIKFPNPPVTNQNGPAFTLVLYGKDPGGNPVPTGLYRGGLRVTSGSMTQDICMNSAVTSAAVPSFSLSQTGLFFSAQVNAGTAAQTVPVFASGGSVAWTAKIQAYPANDNFLTISPTSDTASTAPGTIGSVVTAQVKPETSAGTHYAAIVMTPQAPSTAPPQVVTVVYNVYSGNAAPTLNPAGLVVVGAPGTTSSPQTFSLIPSLAVPGTYSVSTSSAFLSLPVPSGTMTGNTPVSVPVQLLTGSLAQGFNRGSIQIQSNGPAVTMDVLVVYLPQGASVTPARISRAAQAATANCTPTQIAVIGTSLPGAYSISAGWPSFYSARVLDDCANPVANASVVLSFSDGEPPLTLPLEDATTATYAATWTPAAAGQVIVTARASSGSFSASTTTAGTVAANAVPVLARRGTLGNLNPQVGAPVAPGTVASIYGSALAGGTPLGSPGVAPLLTTFQGVVAIVGGVAAPLYFVSDGQLNVQIPLELKSGYTYPVVVATNSGVSVPDSVTISDNSPGIAVYGDGTMIAEHTNFTLVNSASPAAPGETLLMYLVGLGITTPTVATNTPAPSAEPLARVSGVTVTVNGESAALPYVGLTPGAIGLYQIDFTIPKDIPTGSPAVLVKENGVPANATSVPVVAP